MIKEINDKWVYTIGTHDLAHKLNEVIRALNNLDCHSGSVREKILNTEQRETITPSCDKCQKLNDEWYCLICHDFSQFYMVKKG